MDFIAAIQIVFNAQQVVKLAKILTLSVLPALLENIYQTHNV